MRLISIIFFCFYAFNLQNTLASPTSVAGLQLADAAAIENNTSSRGGIGGTGNSPTRTGGIGGTGNSTPTGGIGGTGQVPTLPEFTNIPNIPDIPAPVDFIPDIPGSMPTIVMPPSTASGGVIPNVLIPE